MIYADRETAHAGSVRSQETGRWKRAIPREVNLWSGRPEIVEDGGAWGISLRLPGARLYLEYRSCERNRAVPCLAEYRAPRSGHPAVVGRSLEYCAPRCRIMSDSQELLTK